MSAVGQRRVRWKPSFALIRTNAAAAELVGAIRPFLIVKSKQANALLEFQDRVRKCTRTRDSKGRLQSLATPERMVRDSLFKRVRQMNTRDPAIRRHDRARVGGAAVTRRPSPGYLAGFMDGEGSLMIAKYAGRGLRGYHYRARISIANTNRLVLEEIRRVYGGILARQAPRKPRWNASYHLI
ncbi:MAG TPA: LAGLIDADG family homing endonuclease [Thermoplasmata archaeon]|nr:LAGLIDADG family homing endonuclease [Thermoplasmata archaeon]